MIARWCSALDCTCPVCTAPATVAAAFALTRVLAAGEGAPVGSATEAVAAAAAAAFLADEGARGDLVRLDIARFGRNGESVYSVLVPRRDEKC